MSLRGAPSVCLAMTRAVGRRSMGTRAAARERAGWDCVFIGRRLVQCVCCDGAGTHRGHREGRRIARMGGEEGVNRVFLYELRHTRIPKYSTHKPQSARDSLQRRDRTHKFRTHAAALHAPRARNHHTHNSRSPLLPLSHSALAARLLSYPRLPASLNQHPLFQKPTRTQALISLFLCPSLLSNARTRAARRRPPVCALDRRRLARIGLVVRALREWRAMIRSSSSRVAPLTHTRRGRERGGLDRRTRLI